MTSRDQAQPSADHQFHDRLLIVRFASDDVHPTEVASAKALIERCRDCAALSNDLRSIARATAAMPAPRRHRDFRITADEAHDLRGTAFDRWLRRLAAPRFSILQPLAGTAIAVGLLLVIVGAGLPGNQGATGATDRGGQESAITADATNPPAEGSQAPLPAATEMGSGMAPSERTDVPTPAATSLPSVGGPTVPSATGLDSQFASGQPAEGSAPPTDPNTAAVTSDEPGSKTQGNGSTDATATPAAVGRDVDEVIGTGSNPFAPAALIVGALLAAFGVALLALLVIARRRGRSTLRG